MDKDEVLMQALIAGNLLYEAWEELFPNLKNGVVQNYKLVCSDAPLAWGKAKKAIEDTLNEQSEDSEV